MRERIIASVGCAMCSGGCPYCLGVVGRQPITYRSPLAHRSSGDQSIPVRPAQAHSLPAERLSAGQEPDASSDYVVNDIVHARKNTQEHGECPPSKKATT